MKRITFICMVLLVGVCAAFVPPAVAQHEHPAGDPSKLGKVSFPVSCEPSVQPQFSSAVAMLHSFWYEKASDSFSSKLASDIRRQDDNVSTGRVAGRMLSAHTFTEIVLRTHLIGSTGLSLTLLLHIVFAHCGSRIAQ